MNELLTIPEFAGHLKITVACVRRWIIERRVATVKLGRLIRIPATEVDRFVEDGYRPARNRRPHARQ
jgi:excisionase family DNA binding protein